MERYIGIDDHASTCSLAALDEEGKVVLESTVRTELESLERVLGSVKNRLHVALDRSSFSYQELMYCKSRS